MNKSSYLYKDLLRFAKKIKDEYLEKVDVFPNQLSFEKINELCYEKMYEEISDRDSIKPTPEFYDEIPGLKELNNKAKKYYLNPRNKSVKGLDVQLGNQFDQALIDFLNSHKIVAKRADLKNRRLPDIMVLDKTRNIKAYIELKYHNAPFVFSWRITNRESYEGSITLDSEKLKRQLVEIEAELDRPVYFVHWVDFPDLKGIFFNTHEQVKEYLQQDLIHFVRKERSGDYKNKEYKLGAKSGYTDKFYPPLHEMGDFDELLKNLES